MKKNGNLLTRRMSGILKTSALAVVLAVSTDSYAQFTLDGGVSLVASNEKVMNFVDERPTYVDGNTTYVGDTSYYSYKYSSGGPGVFVYPKYTIRAFKQFGISVGAPVTFALSGGSSQATEFLIDLNAAIDLNGGSYNLTDEDHEKAAFGYYVGIGLGYTNSSGLGYELDYTSGTVNENSPDLVHINSRETDPVTKLSSRSTGLLLQAGIGNFAKLEEVRPILSKLGLRMAYKPSFSRKRLSYFSVTVLYDL